MDETFRRDLQEKTESFRENSTEILGEFQASKNWDNEEYVRKARRAMEIVRRNVDFHYQYRIFQGNIRKGISCPIAIQVDVFTREWYLDFVDVRSRKEVLANLSRFTFLQTGNSASISQEEKRRLRRRGKSRDLRWQ